MHILKLQPVVKTHIRIRQLDAQGKCIDENVGVNTFTRAASDILMAGLLRSGPSQVTHLYARYGDNSESYKGVTPMPLEANTRADFIDNDGQGDPRGGLWVPLQATAVQTTTDASKYSGNKVTYYFRIPYNISVAQTAGAPFSVADSYIATMGLAVARNPMDRSLDQILSVTPYTKWAKPTPFKVAANGQTAIDYTIAITL